jgi:hypothetical protein
MANYITTGVITTIFSVTTGEMKDVNGDVFSYSDATLATRGILLDLGERVICVSDGFMVDSVCSLEDIDAQGLADYNESNSLTALFVKQKLQTYNCCASKQGQLSIDSRAAGDDVCEKQLSDAILMTNLIDSICGIVPEGEAIGGKQATYQTIVTSSVGSKSVAITIGTASYSFLSATATAVDFATDIADNINALYPDSYPYFAEASGANVIISGSSFDEDNGTAITLATTNGTFTSYDPLSLEGGTELILQGENAITNNDIQIILDKLNKLCKIKCTEIFA